MNKKLIAALLVVNLFLSVTTAIPVLADGAAFPSSMYHDLYESAQKAVILYGNCTGSCTGNCTWNRTGNCTENCTGNCTCNCPENCTGNCTCNCTENCAANCTCSCTGNCTGNCTEHLILSVSWQGDAEDFAWVVPVPNIPEITVTNPQLFWELSAFTAIKTPGNGGGVSCYGGAGGPPGGGVDVIEEEVVGPYATAIISATNATALTDWLNANGYTFPEDGEEIISEYIEKEWYFVATRINAVDNDTGYALAAGAIEPMVLSFASDQIVYPLRISSLSATSATSPEVLLYVLTDHVMVPEQYPLYIGYGNWTENAFTLEYGDNVSIKELFEYNYDILLELLFTYFPIHSISDEFYVTKLRGSISADQMVDIDLVAYEDEDSLGSLTETGAKGSDIVSLTMIVGPVLGLYLWRRHRRTTISQDSR